jgi:hypothetical protein
VVQLPSKRHEFTSTRTFGEGLSALTFTPLSSHPVSSALELGYGYGFVEL